MPPFAPEPRAGRAFLVSAAAVALAMALQVEWLESATASFVAFGGIAVAFGLAAWLYAAPSLVEADDAGEAIPAATAPRRWPWATTAAGGVLALALLLLHRDLRSVGAAWLWAAGVAGFLASVAWHERGRGRGQRPPSLDRRDVATALGLLLLALALRVWRLDAIPAEVVDDEAVIAEWGMHLMRGMPLWDGGTAERTTVFRKGAAAEPLLGCLLHAAVMAVAGETIFGLRLAAAIAGALGVALLYLLLREVFGRGAATGGAFLMAVCHTHLYWTRSGMLQSLVTLAATGMVLCMMRGLRTERYTPWLFAGALLGLAQHLYEGGRFLVPIVALFLLLVTVSERGFVARHWRRVGAMALLSAAVFAPLGFWYLREPQTLMAISSGAYIFRQPEYLASRYPDHSTAEIILAQLRRSLHGFLVQSDSSFYAIWVPLFDPIVRALVLAGIAGFTFILRPPLLLLSLWLWVPILIACTVTVDPPPMTRLMLATPALFAVAAAMLDRLGRLAARGFGESGARLATAIGGMMVVAAALWNLDMFFVRYPEQRPINPLTLAAATAAAAADHKVFFVGSDHLNSSAPTVRFLARDVAREDIEPGAIPVQELGKRDALFLVEADLHEAVQRLQAYYPYGELREYRHANGELLFTSYRVGIDEMRRALGPDAYWREPALRFGWAGHGAGEFTEGHALAVDSAGRVYLADTGNRRIDVFTPEGEPLPALGARGSGESAVGHVWALAIEPDGSILALSRRRHRLRRLSPRGELLAFLATEELLQDPVGVAVAPDGTILVLDAGHSAVLRLSRDGEELARAGEHGSGRGQFVRPVALAVDGAGRVFVADYDTGRVQRFSPELEYETEWEIPRSDHELGQVIAVTDADGGAVYVLDAEERRVIRYTPDGLRQWSVGGRGLPPRYLAWPVAVATDARGEVYVVDQERGSVYRYDVSQR